MTATHLLIGIGVFALFCVGVVVSAILSSWFDAQRREIEWTRQQGLRPLWTPDLLEVLTVWSFDDPVAQYLERYHPEKYESYMEARQEFKNAWRAQRLPASWAQQIIRLYREVYAFSMEYEAALGETALRRVKREMLESLRDTSHPPSAKRGATMRRPHYPQLPN